MYEATLGVSALSKKFVVHVNVDLLEHTEYSLYKLRPKRFYTPVIKQITSYIDIIYFYSSKYIPPLSIHLLARSFNFIMPSRKADFKMLLSLKVFTPH
jgi:hypothetical protein